MNWKIWIPLGAATVCGSAAAYIGYELVSRPSQPAVSQKVTTREMVVAKRPVPAGAALAAEDLAIFHIEQSDLPDSALTDLNGLLGKVVIEPLRAGQPIMQGVLASDDIVPGLAAMLPAGYRAMNIEVDPYTGLAGMLVPEARVDVVATLTVEGDSFVRTIAENVLVIAVAGRRAGEAVETTDPEQVRMEKDRSVTLMVTPEQAGKIELATNNTQPRLILRGGADQEPTGFEGIALAELVGEPEMADPFGEQQSVPMQPGIYTSTDYEPISEPIPEPATRPTSQPSMPIASEGFGGAMPVPTDPARHTVPSAPPRVRVVEIVRSGIVSRESFRVDDPTRKPTSKDSTGDRNRTPEQAVVGNETGPVTE